MAPIRMPEAVIGLDVGKSSHWACVATRDGEVLLSAPVANREDDLDSLFGRFPDALVVVDQSRNIGALALARARAAGMSAAYLPGLAAHGAARLFAGDAKTDERDAMVIAKTALGIPDALLPVGDPGPTIAAARALAAQRNFLTCENTRNKNRLRSILLESCPPLFGQRIEQSLAQLRDGVDRGVVQLPAVPGAAHACYARLEGIAYAREHLGARRGGLLRREPLEAGNPSLDLMLGLELAGLVVHRLGLPARAVGLCGEYRLPLRLAGHALAAICLVARVRHRLVGVQAPPPINLAPPRKAGSRPEGRLPSVPCGGG